MSNSIRSVELAAARLGSDEMSDDLQARIWTAVRPDAYHEINGATVFDLVMLLREASDKIKLTRSAALEEAAKVADEIDDAMIKECDRYKQHTDIAHDYLVRATIANDIAASIRALKDKTNE